MVLLVHDQDDMGRLSQSRESIEVITMVFGLDATAIG